MTTPTYITSSNTSVVVASNLTPTSTGVSGGAFAITARTVNNDTITVNAGVKVGGPTILVVSYVTVAYPGGGIRMTGTNDVIVNNGIITGYGQGIDLRPVTVTGGGSFSITNNSGGTIGGSSYANATGNQGFGILATTGFNNLAKTSVGFIGSVSIVNAGLIAGDVASANRNNGILLDSTLVASVTNLSTGTIVGGVEIGGKSFDAVNTTTFYGTAGVVVNSGTILGQSSTGLTGTNRYSNNMDPVYLALGGTVTNLSGGVITPNGASEAIYIDRAVGTVINAGSIGGAVGTLSVKFQSNNAFADRLEIDPGARFGGKVKGGGTSSSILLGSGASVGTIAGANLALTAGSQYYNFGPSVSVASGAQWSITGTASMGSSYSLTNSGTIFNTGTLNIAHLLGSGTIAFGSGSTIMALSSADAASTNVFAGFTAGNTIVVTGTTLTAANLQSSGTVLALPVSGGGTISLNLASSIASSNFFHVSTSGGNTFITENATPCFLAGTGIRTDKGDVPVECLAIGDRVITLDGTAKPIKWIGRRAYASAFAAGNRDIIPVLIKQGALGANLPGRDLYVSPLHAMFFDDVLVQAEHLVNGESVVRCPEIDPIRYFHIELDQHDIVFAEGAPTETFVDCDSRSMFHNAHEFAEMYPGDRTQRWMFCAPRIESGPVLEQIKRGIDSRAGLAAGETQVRPGPLQGNLDGLDGNSITGWAFDPEHPDTPVVLEVLDGAGLVARLTANRFRADLEMAGIGDGRHGFELQLAHSLSTDVRHELRVRRVSDGKELAGSPLAIEPHDRRDLVKDTRRTIEMAANTASDTGTMDALLDTLLQGVDRIRRLRATQRNDHGDERLIARAKPAAARPKRVLVIDDLLPRRNRDAGSTAILSHIEALRTLGWDVEFVASGELSRGDDAVAALKAWGVACHRSPQISSVEEVLRRKRNMFDMVYLHRLSNAEAYAPLVRTWQSKAKIVYSVADLHHVRTARQAQIHRTDELAEAAVLLKARELNAMRMADSVITHSLAEAEYLSREAPGIQVHVVPWALQPQDRSVPFANRQGMAFIGGMRHAPNPDAVRWLAAEIMPRVWARDPALECFLVGADWPAPVWGRLDPRIQLLGQVEQLHEVFDKIRLTVAPVRFGAGIKGKVLDSFAAGVPCVMTLIAAEGIPLAGVLPSAVSDDPAVLAEAILALHGDAGLNAAHAADGLALVRDRYTADAIAAAMETVAGLGTPRAVQPLARVG